jgi:hypothetical protein
MGKYKSLLGWCVLLFSGTTLLSGCSVIGFCVGSAVDPGKEGASVSIPDSLKNLLRETQVFVVKKDSTVVKGVFMGIAQVPDTMSASEYEEEYEQWKAQTGLDSSLLPAIGTTIQVRVRVVAGKDLYAGRFAGFEPGMLRIATPSQAQVISLKLIYIEEISDSLGHVSTSADALQQALDAGAPCCIRLEPSIQLAGQPGVPLDKTARINLREEGDGKWTGLNIGVTLDVAAVLVVGVVAAVHEIERNFPIGPFR